MVSGKDSGQREGKWSAARTMVSGKDSGNDSGQLQAQWSAGRTVDSCKNSGQREGQWSAARTVVSGKDSGQASGQQRSAVNSPYGLCGRKATLKLCEQSWRV